MNDENLLWHKLEQDEGVTVSYRRVVTKTYRMPDGKTAVYGTMDPIGQQYVAVFGVTTDGEVVLAKQFRPGPEKICYELPGGGVEPGENVLEAAKREFLEESGYVGEMQLIAETPADAYSNATRFHCIALGCTKKVDALVNDEYEFIEPTLVSLSDFMKLLYDGELTDTSTALFALRELEKLQQNSK